MLQDKEMPETLKTLLIKTFSSLLTTAITTNDTKATATTTTTVITTITTPLYIKENNHLSLQGSNPIEPST